MWYRIECTSAWIAVGGWSWTSNVTLRFNSILIRFTRESANKRSIFQGQQGPFLHKPKLIPGYSSFNGETDYLVIISLLWSRFSTRKIKEGEARYVGSIHESMHIALMQSIQECLYGIGADACADPFFFFQLSTSVLFLSTLPGFYLYSRPPFYYCISYVFSVCLSCINTTFYRLFAPPNLRIAYTILILTEMPMRNFLVPSQMICSKLTSMTF